MRGRNSPSTYEEVNMIKLENIVKTYGSKENRTYAVNEVSMNIDDGEFVSIMGKSGSGKSTILNIIGCIDSATSGTYYVDDICVSDMSIGKRKKFLRENISFIFQDFALIDDYTVYENIEVPLIAKGKSRKEKKLLLKNI